MRTIRFLRESAYIYDLYYLFMQAYRDDPEDGEDPIPDSFSDFPPELLPFFRMSKSGSCFMLRYFYDLRTASILSTNAYLSNVQSELARTEQMTDWMLRYYFEDLFSEELAQYRRNVTVVNRFIRQSAYPDSFKTCLYDFFLDPVPKLQKLSIELMEKEYELSRFYERSQDKLSEAQRAFTGEALDALLAACGQGSANLTGYEDYRVSFCLLAKDISRYFLNKDHLLFVLGLSYADSLQKMSEAAAAPSLTALGSVLSEPNRVALLNIIRKRRRASIREIENDLDLALPNIYYHISMLQKANLLRSQNQGRTIIYSLNGPYFEKVSALFAEYAADAAK